jgi:hypothetical protein
MRHAWFYRALFSLPFTAACGASPGDDPPRGRAEDAPRARGKRVDVADLLAWTPSGDLAIADGHTGAVLEVAKTLELTGGRDVAYDPWTGRAIVLEADGTAGAAGTAASGEVASYAIVAGQGFGAAPSFGPRTLVATTSGDGRLLPTSLGVVMLGDAGDGWRALFTGGGAPGVAGPPPMSAWAVAKPEGLVVHALAYGPSSGELDAAQATVGPASVGPVSVAVLDVAAGTLPPSARVVAAPARGGALLLDVGGSFLSVRGLAGAAAGPASLAPLGAEGLRIEGALALEDGAVVVALLSGETRVVALEVGGAIAIASMAEVTLPGDPAPSTRFFSHDLAVQAPGRVAAATSAGVFAIEVTLDADGVHLALDPGFDGGALLGPLDGIRPR